MKQGNGELVDQIYPVLLSIMRYISFFLLLTPSNINDCCTLSDINNQNDAVRLCARSGFLYKKSANLMNYQASQKG